MAAQEDVSAQRYSVDWHLSSPSALHWPVLENIRDFATQGGSDAQCSQSQSALLAIPRELRDMIYAHLIDATGKVPPDGILAGPRVLSIRSRLPQRHVEYATSLPMNHIASYLAVNHQIRAEILDYFTKIPRLHAELDIRTKGRSARPTWTCLPSLLSYNKRIDLTVHDRQLTSEIYMFHAASADPRNKAAAGFGITVLLTLFTQFLSRGPALGRLETQEREEGRARFRIGRLTLMLSCHDNYNPDIFRFGFDALVKDVRQLAARGDMREYVQSIRLVYEAAGNVLPELVGFEMECEMPDVRNEEAIRVCQAKHLFFEPSDCVEFRVAGETLGRNTTSR